MRTAEEILRQFISKDCIWDEGYEGEWKLSNTPSEYVRQAINEARIEAIKECAESVQQSYNLTIDKQSILKLIDQVK